MGLARQVSIAAPLLAALTVLLSFREELHPHLPYLGTLQRGTLDAWALLRPGGKLHPAGFIEHRGHLVLEGSLLVVIVYLLFQASFKPTKAITEPLTAKEIDELCEEWQPEPLAGPLTEFQRHWVTEPVVSSNAGPRVTVAGLRALNMVSTSFLGLAGSPAVREACRATIKKYGVGSCGPRGFYGTIDVHLELEQRLARYMGVEEAILYSYDLATLPSIIPAFANKKDLIVVDDGANYAIINGCNLSRARLLRFRHNDVTDLERVLKQVAEEDARQRRPLNRRFIVVEGIYANTGDLAPLAAIRELKRKYKYRLVVDESLALGVLGDKGRGAAEHAGYEPQEAEIVGASLGEIFEFKASCHPFCSASRGSRKPTHDLKHASSL
jgi:serine palmitoyltransferase